MINENDNLIRRFLLGELPDKQREAVEERLFREDDFYSEVVAIQEELADDFVNADLLPEERAQLKEFFAKSPLRQKRVEFATALSQALVDPGPSDLTNPAKSKWWEPIFTLFRPGVAFAATAAAIVMVILCAWLWVQNRRLTKTVDETRVENDSMQHLARATQEDAARRAKALEDELAVLKTERGSLKADIDRKEKELESLRQAAASRAPRTESAFTAFILAPGLTRGNDEPEKLIIPTSAKGVRIQLDLEREENYKGFVAEIRTARGNLVWSRSGLTMQRTNYGHAVAIVVPASVLSNGEYEVSLKGVSGRNFQSVGYYYFITQRR